MANFTAQSAATAIMLVAALGFALLLLIWGRRNLARVIGDHGRSGAIPMN